MERSKGNAVVRLNATFEEHPLVTIDDGSQPLWLAPQVAEALGYADAGNISGYIRTKWSNDITEGVDFRLATKAELDALKAVGAVGKNAPSLMLLTESGVFAVALLSRQPAATRLRQWLSREVLPQIRATGRYEASPSEAGPMVDEDAVRARVLVELHGEGVLDDRGLVKRLDDEQLTALPGAVLGPLVRRLASGEAPPEVSTALAPISNAWRAVSGRSTGNLLTLLVEWAKKNPHRMVGGAARAPGAGWCGRWLEERGRLAIRRSVADAIFTDAGLNADACCRQLRRDRAVISHEHEPGTLTMPVTLGGEKARCLVFEVRHAG